MHLQTKINKNPNKTKKATSNTKNFFMGFKYAQNETRITSRLPEVVRLQCSIFMRSKKPLPGTC